jgi:hypothetical protein
MIRALAAAVLVAGLAVGGWFGYRALTPAAPARVEQAIPESDAAPVDTGSVETIRTGQDAPDNGGTPMAQRVAVLGLLNKRNGESRELSLRPGQATRIGDVAVRLRACERTAPWEQEPLTGAFVQVIVRGADRHWRRTFSGWLFKERPALNVVQHPVYDVWIKSCTMSFPATGPDTETLSPRRSSAPKSPATVDAADEADGEAGDAPPTTPASATPSNAT